MRRFRSLAPVCTFALVWLAPGASWAAGKKLSTAPYKGGWVYTEMGVPAFLLALAFVLFVALSYYALRPRFAAAAAKAPAGPPTPSTPVPPPRLAPVPPIDAPPTPPAASAAAAPAVEAAVVATPSARSAATTPAPAVPTVSATTPAPRPGHVEPDKETYDRVLAEQLAKGVNEKVAEGRARAAGVVAARKKAGG